MDIMAWFPENMSTFGVEYDNLFLAIWYISIAIFVLVFALGIWFIIQYRYSPTRKAYHYHGNNLIEFTWTLLPTLLFAGIGVYSDSMWKEAKYESVFPDGDIKVEVLGMQYQWLFRYPGADGIFGKSDRVLMSATNQFGIDPNDPNGKDDIITINQLHLPINRTIRFHMSALDVIHSFFLPHTRLKQDILPGHWVDMWLIPTKAGKYEIACAELCGSGHYAMRGEVTYHSQANFNKWMDQQTKNKQLAIDEENGIIPAASPAPAADTTAAPSVSDTTSSATPATANQDSATARGTAH